METTYSTIHCGLTIERHNMIQIKLRYSGKVIKEVDATSLVNADLLGADLRGADLQGASLQCASLIGADLQGAGLQGADLQGASLQCASLQCTNLQGAKLQRASLIGADLQGAGLQGADLQDTDIRWVSGDEKRIKTIYDRYRIVIMSEYGVMAIGCEQHSIDKWMNFSDKEIDKMETGALHWWKVWKPRIRQLIAS
jgi:hypothetical protein